MGMTAGFCSACFARWEYYQHRNEMPECPYCGGFYGKDKEELHKAYYRAMGVKCAC